MTSIIPNALLDELKDGIETIQGGIVRAPIMPSLRKAVALIEKAAEPDDGSINSKFTATISTSKVDRDGDIIDIAGWQLKNFRKNPVLLFAHDTRRVIGGVDVVEPSGEKLVAKFHVNTDIPLGLEVATLLNAKDLRATSVGLNVIKGHTILQGKEENCEVCLSHKGEPRGSFFRQAMHLTEQELMELSVVAVPANVGALVRMKDAASRLTLGTGALELQSVDEDSLTNDRLASLERRVDALALQAGGVKVQSDDGAGDDGGGAALLTATIASEKVRRALRDS
jgi:phage head maturation protease